MRLGTPLGIEAKKFVDQGLLVPDEITIGIVRERIKKKIARMASYGWISKNDFTSEALDEILDAMDKKIDHVINLNVDRNLLLARLTGRRICKSCGATYHVIFNPPKQELVCDKCAGELYQRSDDTEEKVGTRLDEYLSKTAPLLEYYDNQKILRQVNGEQEINAVTAEINTLLRGQS